LYSTISTPPDPPETKLLSFCPPCALTRKKRKIGTRKREREGREKSQAVVFIILFILFGLLVFFTFMRARAWKKKKESRLFLKPPAQTISPPDGRRSQIARCAPYQAAAAD
jgi:hypothetical protein